MLSFSLMEDRRIGRNASRNEMTDRTKSAAWTGRYFGMRDPGMELRSALYYARPCRELATAQSGPLGSFTRRR